MIASKDINFTKVSSMIAFGCSYTYGSGLRDPIQDSWVSVLGRLLKIPNVYNLGIPGNSDQVICMRAIDYIEKYRMPILNSNLDTAKIFIIVMLSYNFRKFYPMHDSNNKVSYIHIHDNIKYMRQKFSIFQSPLNLKRIVLKHMHSLVTSMNNFYKLTIFNDPQYNTRYTKLLISYLNQLKYPYIIVPSNHDSFPTLDNDIEGYMNFVKLRKYEVEPEEYGGHPLEEGNKAYAEYLYGKLSAKLENR